MGINQWTTHWGIVLWLFSEACGVLIISWFHFRLCSSFRLSIKSKYLQKCGWIITQSFTLSLKLYTICGCGCLRSVIGTEWILHQSSGENIGINIIPTQQCFGLDYMTIIQHFSRSTHDQVVLPVICAHKGSNAVIEGKQGDRNKGATQEVIVNMSMLASAFSWKPNSYLV